MLSNEEIDRLNQFCLEHYVGYYDVRLELVDHLASSIEDMMGKDPRLSFEIALEKTYRQFGYEGFSGVVEAKEKEMNAVYSEQLMRLYKGYFTLPKVAFTGMLAVICYSLPFFCSVRELKWVMIFEILLLSAIEVRTYWLSRRDRPQKDRTLLMLKKVNVLALTAVMWPANLVNILRLVDKNSLHLSPYGVYDLFTLVFVLVVPVSLCRATVAKQVRQNARALYPEAFA